MKKIDVEKQDSVKLYKIRKTLEELSKKSGRGTELITVYIPKGKQLLKISIKHRQPKQQHDLSIPWILYKKHRLRRVDITP